MGDGAGRGGVGGEERIHMDTAKLYRDFELLRTGFRVSGACEVRRRLCRVTFQRGRGNKSKKKKKRAAECQSRGRFSPAV